MVVSETAVFVTETLELVGVGHAWGELGEVNVPLSRFLSGFVVFSVVGIRLMVR